MADVSISFSRRDRHYVRALHDGSTGRGREVRADLEDIPPTAEWLAEIYAGIEAADSVVFVLSPDAAASAVCRNEVEHALRHNQRLVPVLVHEVDHAAVPETLAARNCIDSIDGSPALRQESWRMARAAR